jgi:hypothetical protein
VPRFRLRIALSTLVDAFFEYRLRVVAIGHPPHRSSSDHELPSFCRGPRRATARRAGSSRSTSISVESAARVRGDARRSASSSLPIP